MRTIAVTGGIGSGKSAFCSILSERGIPVYDCDSAAKRLYAEDASLLDSIEEAFGCSVRHGDGSFDKARLASLIFTSQDNLRTLEAIVHPAVLEDFIRWKSGKEAMLADGYDPEVFFGKEPFVVMESAIILSKPDYLEHVDRVILVDAGLQVRLRRACERDGVSPEKVIERMALQHFDVSRVDHVVRNEGSLEELRDSLPKVFSEISL